MKDDWRNNYRIVAPIKRQVHRFAYLGLVLAAVALMMLGKADVLLVERARSHLTDALAPLLNLALGEDLGKDFKAVLQAREDAQR